MIILDCLRSCSVRPAVRRKTPMPTTAKPNKKGIIVFASFFAVLSHGSASLGCGMACNSRRLAGQTFSSGRSQGAVQRNGSLFVLQSQPCFPPDLNVLHSSWCVNIASILLSILTRTPRSCFNTRCPHFDNDCKSALDYVLYNISFFSSPSPPKKNT